GKVAASSCEIDTKGVTRALARGERSARAETSMTFGVRVTVSVGSQRAPKSIRGRILSSHEADRAPPSRTPPRPRDVVARGRRAALGRGDREGAPRPAALRPREEAARS